jgi:hypothetical protein
MITSALSQSKLSPFRFRALRGDATPRDGASALASGVVARGRQMVEEIEVRTFIVPRMWRREDEDEEDTRVEGLATR